jgi:hypothetical protein
MQEPTRPGSTQVSSNVVPLILWVLSRCLGEIHDKVNLFSSQRGYQLLRRSQLIVRFRMDSKTTPCVSPIKGSTPVAISYSTTPNEKKSVRVSSGFPLTCSGDM